MDEFPVFLRGKKTILRPMDQEADAKVMLGWINDISVIRLTSAYLPMTLQMEREWIGKVGKDDKSIQFALEAIEPGGKRILIGAMGFNQIKWKDRVATTGAMIGNKDYWGKGYGTDAKMQLINYGFNTLNLHKLCSDVYAFNERSLKYSLTCGYQEEGRRRQHAFVDGQYVDVVHLGLFQEDWLPIWKKYQESDE
jgi:RimJ/RimL family protein N-acetyltransferase